MFYVPDPADFNKITFFLESQEISSEDWVDDIQKAVKCAGKCISQLLNFDLNGSKSSEYWNLSARSTSIVFVVMPAASRARKLGNSPLPEYWNVPAISVAWNASRHQNNKTDPSAHPKDCTRNHPRHPDNQICLRPVHQIWRIELNGPMSNHVQPKAALVFPIQSKYIQTTFAVKDHQQHCNHNIFKIL